MGWTLNWELGWYVTSTTRSSSEDVAYFLASITPPQPSNLGPHQIRHMRLVVHFKRSDAKSMILRIPLNSICSKYDRHCKTWNTNVLNFISQLSKNVRRHIRQYVAPSEVSEQSKGPVEYAVRATIEQENLLPYTPSPAHAVESCGELIGKGW